MEFSIRRVNALFKKELKDFGKNKNVLLMCLLPIIFSIIYSQLFGQEGSADGIGQAQILTLCLGMSLALVATFVISMLIAEEKEKNTLRTLMLSAVSPWEFLAGKALITLLTSVITNALMFFIIGMDTQYLGIYMLLTTLVVLSMIELGAVIGIIAPNQMSTGVVGMPIIMLLLMVPLFARLNKTLTTIAEFLPNYNMNCMLEKLFNGGSVFSGSGYNIAVILVWLPAAAAVFAFTYKKKGLDK